MDGPDFSVKFPNFSKCLQKTVTLRQYTKDNIRKGDERPEHKIKTEMQFLIHMILLLKLTGWLEYQPGRRDRQMRTHAKGMGFFYFMRLWLIFAEVCPTGPVRFILKKEYAALPQQSKRLLFMCLFRILVAEQESIKKRLENHKDYVNN